MDTKVFEFEFEFGFDKRSGSRLEQPDYITLLLYGVSMLKQNPAVTRWRSRNRTHAAKQVGSVNPLP